MVQNVSGRIQEGFVTVRKESGKTNFWLRVLPEYLLFSILEWGLTRPSHPFTALKQALPMDPYQETFDTWNKVAALYQDKFMDLDLYDHTYDHICTSIPKPNAQILEIGCGPGNITRYLLIHRPDFSIFGIDIAPNMIDLARKNNPTANFAVMDSREIKNLNQKYDGIIVGFCLPYLSESECKELISDAGGLLTDEGLIYLSFVEGDESRSGFLTGSNGRVYFHYHHPDKLKSYLMESNFEEPETYRVTYKKSETEVEIHTILIARNKPHCP